MVDREVKQIDQDSLTEELAGKIAAAFDSGEGIMLHILEGEGKGLDYTETRAQIRHCRDLDAVTSLLKRTEHEYPVVVLGQTLDAAIEAAESYGEFEGDMALRDPTQWHDIPGFEVVDHLYETLATVLEPKPKEGELITLRANMGAAPPMLVARSPEWSAAIEDTAEPQLPVLMLGTLDSLRELLS